MTVDYKLPEGLRGLFATPSLMAGESADEYHSLCRHVEEVVSPKDIVDQMLVTDVCNHFWEQRRLRLCSGDVIKAYRHRALTQILLRANSSNQYAEMDADAYFNNVQEPQPKFTKARVVEKLRRDGLTEASIDAVALELALPTLERLENLCCKHEIRRDEILAEIERRRKRRRRAMQQGALPRAAGPQLLPSPAAVAPKLPDAA